MAVTKLVLGDNVGHKPAQAQTMLPLPTDEVNQQVGGSIDSVRVEVDDAFEDMKTFLHRNPDEIMRIARGHSARLSEIRVRIMRVEDYARQWKPVRTREIEPCLDELRDQYQCASRLEAVRALDYQIESGGT